MSQVPVRGKIGLVLKGYPRLSETFIAQEILELERAGFEISIISLRHPTDTKTHPIHDEIVADRNYLPEYLRHEPMRVLKGLLYCLPKPGFWKLLPVFLKDLARDRTPNRIRRFGQSLVMAREYAPRVDFFYVHFLHTPCSTVRYCSIVTGHRFAISAHAKDIWTSPEWEIVEKLDACEWLTTCTQGAATYLQTLSQPDTVHLNYHGLDLSRFPENVRKASKNDGSTKAKTIQLVTVGRAVTKKGIDALLEALARLPEALHWHWTHIGGGPLRGDLKAQAEALGIADRCDFRGALPQSEVLETYRKSDLFILPSRIDKTGDRDGLPNVIVEAQSQKLAVLSTNISGIPELMEDGLNGVLIEPDDIEALVREVSRLGQDPELRANMGEAGNRIVREKFDHLNAIGSLVTLMEESLEKVR